MDNFELAFREMRFVAMRIEVDEEKLSDMLSDKQFLSAFGYAAEKINDSRVATMSSDVVKGTIHADGPLAIAALAYFYGIALDTDERAEILMAPWRTASNI